MTSLPDTRLAVITGLTLSLTVPDPVTIGGAVPDELLGALPYVAVYRPPSPPPRRWNREDRALLNIQAWAATEQAARDTIAAVHDALHDMPGQTIGSVVIREVTDITGIGHVPDPGYPDLARCTASYQVTARNA